ncbi:potassium channel family protein [Intestinibacter bartlettii]|uniref:potassium channel family protein n=1 Tax=Intestinibacter bartlettii TaxID=261299 RepID=UPI00082149E8|nr:potassium channel family protein [Intestinibacter bartlettii]SCI89820.1 Ion channel [uncultured Clostridium sp.]
MIRLFFILITLFAVEKVVSKRINTYKIKKVKTLIHQINNQYKYLFKGKSEYINFYQWLILFISQAFVVYALVRYIVKKIFRYVEENYILFGKTLTIIVLILFLYFVIGYLLLSISKIYKFLYKIEDKVTKTDLLISYFIISMYMTILIIFPGEFAKNYKIGLVGVALSYFLNLKVLLRIIRSPEITDFKGQTKKTDGLDSVGVMAVIVLLMVVISLALAVCFISCSGEGVYTNNPTFFDLFYYTIITFATVGYGDISPVSPIAKFMSIVISMTSILCLTVFISSVLSYKGTED